MSIEVTSASRREQRVEDVPAPVYVIGRDEIRRSGMTSIPELLRLAPGVQVARINSNKWAVSVRGFNSLYSNKLLVTVDGRSIYNPAFSAVLWDTEDTVLEDIERIEVIRGPGGAMWGANAVNGVINIITRPASGVVGNPDFSNENLVNTEAGYRFNVGSTWSVDVVGFSGRYDDLQTFEPLPPSLDVSGGVPRMKLLTRYENRMRADTLGAEIFSRVQLRDGWQVDGAFSAFRLTPHTNGSQDPSVPAYEGHAPSSQWRMHLATPLFARDQADVHLFQTGSLPQLAVDSYTRLDTRMEWSLTGQLSVVASGQNLLSAAHAEFRGHETNMQSTLVPRRVGVRLVCLF
jgi:outer membrane receptor for ferrienterochelin and colicin